MGFRIKSQKVVMAIRATIKDGAICLPKGVLRRAHLPENRDCQVEVGDHIVELRRLPEQYPSWELPEEKRSMKVLSLPILRITCKLRQPQSSA